MTKVARAVLLWRLFAYACLAAFYSPALLPLWRLPWGRPGSLSTTALAAPMVHTVALLLVASLSHHMFSIMVAPSIRAFVWHDSLEDLKADVASRLFTRSPHLHAWVDRVPGVIAIEGQRLLLCTLETGYEVQRIEVGDVSCLRLDWTEGRPPLLDIIYHSRCSRRPRCSTVTFHDDEQALRWRDRLEPFLSHHAEAHYDNR